MILFSLALLTQVVGVVVVVVVVLVVLIVALDVTQISTQTNFGKRAPFPKFVFELILIVVVLLPK